MTDDVPMTFFLFDKIDSNSAKEVVEWIFNANLMEVPYKYLTLVICSEGGELDPAFAIIDSMESSNIPIRTIGMGQVLSSAFMIFITGQKGFRTLKPNTSTLTHRFSAGSEGKYHDLIAITKEFEFKNERMVEHYIKQTGLTKVEVESWLLSHSDVYLTPEEARQLKCTDIVG